MQTITVKYLGPTNLKGSRYKATHTGASRSITVGADCSLSCEENMTVAATLLAQKLNWDGKFIGGHIAGGDMVFVHAKPLYSFTVKREEEVAE